ncbi:hypothetical protein [Sinorhizobium medicae]|uniref:hypothetical protein n=1 Tax=Sinorhizobium medicae TaxID=110321 RepID=UPI001912F856|nr:hypothetical protein [Sinorhizobium medicae]
MSEPTAEWSLVLGDHVHNLRSCLDYAMCGVVEAADPAGDLSRVQFPFGRLGQQLNLNERRIIDGLAPGAIKQIEGIRTRFGADLNFINEQSGQAPTAHSRFCQASANEAANHEAGSTASIDDDIAGTVEVWTREIKERDQLAMPHMLKRRRLHPPGSNLLNGLC